MSGIYGILNKKKNSRIDQQEVQSLHDWNLAYGKEANIVFENEGRFMGWCLETYAEHSYSKSIVLKKEGWVAVIDAILFNREELCQKLHVLEEVSDEELLFWYVLGFGLDALAHVNGDYAGVLFNLDRQELTLFRDHMGVRPLFYYNDASRFVFSTDIRGILALSEEKIDIDEEWVYRTIMGYSTSTTTNTEYANIFCVEPSSYYCISLASEDAPLEAHKYWTLGKQKIRFQTEKEYMDGLRELIIDAVKRRLDAFQGVVGAELSGGLDSGVIDVLIHRFERDAVFFSWSEDPSELPFVERDERLVVEDICRQENIHCNYGKNLKELYDNSILKENLMKIGCTILQEPIPYRYAMPPYINTLQISEVAQGVCREGGRVVFTGHGGDEGVSHRCNPYELFYHKEYGHFFHTIWQTMYGRKFRALRTIKKSFQILTTTRIGLKGVYRHPFCVPELLKPDFVKRYADEKMPSMEFAFDTIAYINTGGSRNRLDNIALQGAYSNVRYVVPYLDYRVIDYAVSIPRHLYLKGNQTRYIFREAFAYLMPESLYKLRTKEDFSTKNKTDKKNWFEEYQKTKNEIVEMMSRSYWEKYIDYETVDAWLKEEEPSGKDRMRSQSILFCLGMCAMAENCMIKSTLN